MSGKGKENDTKGLALAALAITFGFVWALGGIIVLVIHDVPRIELFEINPPLEKWHEGITEKLKYLSQFVALTSYTGVICAFDAFFELFGQLLLL